MLGLKMEPGNLGMDDNLQLIDFSIEDDYLVAFFPHDDGFDGFRLSVNSENRSEQSGAVLIKNQPEQEHKASESVKHRREESSSRTSSLRSSFAWDTAFSTSEGILDVEELFAVNKEGFGKEETYLLYEITEDMKGLAELSCLLDSSRLSSGDLEANLFDDIRASIEKSRETFKKRSSGFKSGSGRWQSTNASKKVDHISQKKMNKPASKSRSSSVQRPGRTKKEPYIKSQAIQNDIRSGGLSSTISARIVEKIRPMSEAPTKSGGPLGVNHVKVQNKAAGGTKKRGSRVSKRSGRGDSKDPVSGSTQSFSSFASPSSSYSTGSSGGKSDSVSSVKSFSNFLRKKVDLGNPRVAARSSDIKLPKKYQTDNKTELGNSSTSIPGSPASSTGRCSWKSASDGLQRRPGYDTHSENDCQETRLPKGSATTAKGASRFYKAYGRQMPPSHKMEFLDEGKLISPTPDGDLHFQTSRLPRNGTGFCNPCGGANGEPRQENSVNTGKAVSVDREASKLAHRTTVQLEDKDSKEWCKNKLVKGRNPERNGKENITNHEDGVYMLSKQMCALNFGGDVIIDLKGKKDRCQVQSGNKSTKNYRDILHDFHSANECVQSTKTPLTAIVSLCNITEGKGA